MRKSLGLLAFAGALSTGVVSVHAAAWDNLAPSPGTITSNNSAAGPLIDKEAGVGGSRWHQSGDADTTPIKLDFVRATPNQASFVRFWNWTDPGSNFGGTAVYRLQSLNIGGNPVLDADWTDIPGTSTTFSGSPAQFKSQSFAPVTTRGLRWLWTEDNNDAGNGNLRYTEFEYYSENVDNLDFTTGTHSGVTLTSATWSKTGSATVNLITDGRAFDNQLDSSHRFDAPSNGHAVPQFVTLLWDNVFLPQDFRIFSEDQGQRIEDYSVEYLRQDGDPLNPADWITFQTFNPSSPSSNILDLAINQYTRGLRLNINDPSTNGGDEHLRLWELEVFGIVPEPACIGLLAGLLPLVARRRRSVAMA